MSERDSGRRGEERPHPSSNSPKTRREGWDDDGGMEGEREERVKRWGSQEYIYLLI